MLVFRKLLCTHLFEVSFSHLKMLHHTIVDYLWYAGEIYIDIATYRNISLFKKGIYLSVALFVAVYSFFFCRLVYFNTFNF